MVANNFHKEYKVLINLIYAYRIKAGLKQIEVAEKLNVPQSFISKIENGERKIDLVELIRLCEIFNIPIQEFIETYFKLINESK